MNIPASGPRDPEFPVSGATSASSSSSSVTPVKGPSDQVAQAIEQSPNIEDLTDEQIDSIWDSVSGAGNDSRSREDSLSGSSGPRYQSADASPLPALAEDVHFSFERFDGRPPPLSESSSPRAPRTNRSDSVSSTSSFADASLDAALDKRPELQRPLRRVENLVTTALRTGKDADIERAKTEIIAVYEMGREDRLPNAVTDELVRLNASLIPGRRAGREDKGPAVKDDAPVPGDSKAGSEPTFDDAINPINRRLYRALRDFCKTSHCLENFEYLAATSEFIARYDSGDEHIEPLLDEIMVRSNAVKGFDLPLITIGELPVGVDLEQEMEIPAAARKFCPDNAVVNLSGAMRLDLQAAYPRLGGKPNQKTREAVVATQKTVREMFCSGQGIFALFLASKDYRKFQESSKRFAEQPRRGAAVGSSEPSSPARSRSPFQIFSSEPSPRTPGGVRALPVRGNAAPGSPRQVESGSPVPKASPRGSPNKSER